MTSISESDIRDALARIDDPQTGKDLEASGWVRAVGVDGGGVAVDVRFGYPVVGGEDEWRARIEEAVDAVPGVERSAVSVGWKVAAHAVQENVEPLPGIRNIIAVASGKGGVGKSTVAVNLALALSRDGARVGVLDADIYGPSMPRMLGVSGRPDTEDQTIVPKRAHGLAVMSIGFLVEEDTPMIWRGPMVTSALQQLLGETAWGDLDYLVIDLPPGTGDIQLTLAQKVPVAGAVIVTTPQDIALLDARKAVQMFRRVNVPVLGVIENMALHTCSACGHQEALFGSGGGQRIVDDYDIPLLGQLPLAMAIREGLDRGAPTVAEQPDSPEGAAFIAAARRMAGVLSQQPKSRSAGLPGIQLHSA